jgi:hypothetical protein
VKSTAAKCILSFLLFAGSTVAQQNQSKPQASAPSHTNDVQTTMKNVQYRLTDKIIVHIAILNGKLTPKPDQIVVFDDNKSFSIAVDSAKVSLTTTSLTNDLNDFVFAKPDAPIKNISASIEGDQLTIKGLLVSKGGVPFSSTGTLSVTPEGMIRVHTSKVNALHLPVKGLMDMLGLDTEKLLDTQKVPGVSVDKDDLILDPQYILPPPQLQGRLSSIKIVKEEILLTFGDTEGKGSEPALTDTCGAQNYLQFKGATVRFGNLTMEPADLLLMDMQPTDPFDFAIDHYKEQLAAGYSKMTLAGGLCVHMPDYDKLTHRPNRKK